MGARYLGLRPGGLRRSHTSVRRPVQRVRVVVAVPRGASWWCAPCPLNRPRFKFVRGVPVSMSPSARNSELVAVARSGVVVHELDNMDTAGLLVTFPSELVTLERERLDPDGVCSHCPDSRAWPCPYVLCCWDARATLGCAAAEWASHA